MELSETLVRTFIHRLTEFDSLGKLICPDLIQSSLKSNDVATLVQSD